MDGLENFKVRQVTVSHPLGFLHSIQKQLATVLPTLRVKKGMQFHAADASADRKALEDNFPLPSDLTVPVAIQIATVTVTNCTDGQLDVEYFVLSSQFLPVLTGSIESRRREDTAPQDALHAVESPHKKSASSKPRAPAASTFRLTPIAGYTLSDHLFGGGHLRILSPETGLLKSFDLEGVASPVFHSVSAALEGSANPNGLIRSLDWQFSFRHQSLPTAGTYLRQGSLTGQFAATTKPLSSIGLLFRFGGQVEGGNMQSGFSAASLAPGTVSSSGYGALKLYGGLTFGSEHQTFSASYGLELGGTSAQLGVDWHKQLGDVSWDIWFPIGDHRPMQIETRFTAGGMQASHGAMIPVAERFFGGNVQQSFIPGDKWDFRANPVIRGIPAQSFFATATGAGADRFTAFNLTAAPVTWHSPLLPKEIADDKSFEGMVQTGWDQSEANLAATYKAKDPHAAAMAKRLPDAEAALATLARAVTAVKPGGTPSAEWAGCNLAIIRALGRVKGTLRLKDATRTYANLIDLTSDPSGKTSSNLLPRVIESCDVKLNATLKNAEITDAVQNVKTVLDALESEHKRIDEQKAIALAQHDLIYPQRVFRTLVHDLNLWSVSPVGLFDVARIGPAPTDAHGGLRYSVGGGVRVILVSHVNFTAGYARNLHRGPGEGTGALFFSMGITELLR